MPPDAPPETTTQSREWTLKPGTLIHINGLPYRVIEATVSGFHEPTDPPPFIRGCFSSSDPLPPADKP